MKFAIQNFPYVRIFVFRETIKFLSTLQARQFPYIVTPNSVKLYTIFLHLDSILAPNPQCGSLQSSCIPHSFWKELLSKFLWITSEKIIQTLDHCPVKLSHLFGSSFSFLFFFFFFWLWYYYFFFIKSWKIKLKSNTITYKLFKTKHISFLFGGGFILFLFFFFFI